MFTCVGDISVVSAEVCVKLFTCFKDTSLVSIVACQLFTGVRDISIISVVVGYLHVSETYQSFQPKFVQLFTCFRVSEI